MVRFGRKADYSANPEKRALQLEARAHIEVQRMIDGGQAPKASPLSPGDLRYADPSRGEIIA